MKVFDAASETLQPAASKVLRTSCVLARQSPSARKFTDNKSTCPSRFSWKGRWSPPGRMRPSITFFQSTAIVTRESRSIT